jgi:hypothetical protein
MAAEVQTVTSHGKINHRGEQVREPIPVRRLWHTTIEKLSSEVPCSVVGAACVAGTFRGGSQQHPPIWFGLHIQNTARP